ncbi:hypothetical protein [Maribacter antarcticus]|uniref:hypothetical protein n=1 Tax=Maribacter antarcticus TaxID=505250 RepID=UPI000A3FD509|nr:hypothetical protein [Maribacter antarcticus]
MRIKIIQSLFTVMILSSCIKDFYGHPNDKDRILTESNYVYTDDLKSAHLQTIVTQLNIELKQTDPDKEKEKFDLLNDELEETQSTLSDLAEFRKSVFKRRPPLPPCPNPQSCIKWLGVQYLTQRAGLAKLQMIIYDENQNIIAQTEGNLEQLTGLEVPLDYVVLIFKNPEYRGAIQIKVIETMGKVETAFSVASEIK